MRTILSEAALEVEEIASGNLSTILKASTPSRSWAVRIRVNEHLYRYPPRDALREPIIAALLDSDAPVQVRIESVRRILAAPSSHCDLGAPPLPRLRYYDRTKRHIPFSFSVYEWVEGRPLWTAPERSDYRTAGRFLKRLHSVVFDASYEDITFSSETGRGRGLDRLMEKELRQASKGLGPDLSSRIGHRVSRLFSQRGAAKAGRHLLHNDYSGANLLFQARSLAGVIDWDNLTIGTRFLDFTKMRYWTSIRRDRLSFDRDSFESFLEGYGISADELRASADWQIAKALWLLRVYNFECSKEKDGQPALPPYLPSGAYRQMMEDASGEKEQL